MIKWLHTRKGFTLVEVIIVLVISGIVAVIAVPSVSNYISYTSAKECKALISDLTSDIRKIVTTNKYSSDTYKVDISTAVKNELAELSGGIFDNKSTKLSAINEETSTVTFIAPLIEANSSVDGEIYTVTLGFSDTDVKVSVKCSVDEHNQKSEAGKTEGKETGESMSIYFGKSVADIATKESTKDDPLKTGISEFLINCTGYYSLGDDGLVTFNLSTIAKAIEALNTYTGYKFSTDAQKTKIYVDTTTNKVKQITATLADDTLLNKIFDSTTEDNKTSTEKSEDANKQQE